MNQEECSVCGWKEGTCDFHHIDGRKFSTADTEYHITLLCPNCHRLVHEKKIKKRVLVPLSKTLGKRWRNYIVVHRQDENVHYSIRE